MSGRLDEERKSPTSDSQGKLGRNIEQFNDVFLELHGQSQ